MCFIRIPAETLQPRLGHVQIDLYAYGYMVEMYYFAKGLVGRLSRAS